MAEKIEERHRDIIFTLKGDTLKQYEFLAECFLDEDEMKQSILEAGLQTLDWALFDDEDTPDN